MTDRTNPFEEVEQLFEQFSQLGDPLGGELPVDIIDTEDTLLVKADLPGRDPESVTVQLEDDRHLHIEASEGETKSEGRYVAHERTQQSVSRSVTLPAAVDEAETEAEYDRGVLTVHLPKLSGDGDGTDIPVN